MTFVGAMDHVAKGLAFANAPVTSLLAAMLPSSRSVQVGVPATAFATIINAGSVTATGCGISVIPAIAGQLFLPEHRSGHQSGHGESKHTSEYSGRRGAKFCHLPDTHNSHNVYGCAIQLWLYQRQLGAQLRWPEHTFVFRVSHTGS